MRKSLLTWTSSNLLFYLIFFGIILVQSELYSQKAPMPDPTPILPCVPECRNEPRVDFETLDTSGPDTVFIKDQFIISISIDSLDCQRLIEISMTRTHQLKVDSILRDYGIPIKSDLGSAVTGLCRSDNRLVIDEIKKYYVKSVLDRIRSESQDSRVNPNDNSIQKCLCDKEIYLYEGLNIESESFVNATQQDDEFESNGGTISRNLVIEAHKNSIQLPKRTPSGEVPDLNPNPDKIVAILDSGIDVNFFHNYIYAEDQTDDCIEGDVFGWNFIDDNYNTQDYFGHGTVVAASFKYALDVESSQSNGPEINYKILPVKVLDDCGYGTLYSVTCGLYYAQAKGADVVNTSWGLYHHRIQLEQAIIDLANGGIQIVASTGNDQYDLSTTDHFPSGYSSIYSPLYDTIQTDTNVYAVGGMDQPFNMQERCNLDKWSQSNYYSFTIIENALGYSDLFNTQPFSSIVSQTVDCPCEGTSYAAPRFSAALVKEPTLDINLSRYRIKETAQDTLSSYWTNKWCNANAH